MYQITNLQVIPECKITGSKFKSNDKDATIATMLAQSIAVLPFDDANKAQEAYSLALRLNAAKEPFIEVTKSESEMVALTITGNKLPAWLKAQFNESLIQPVPKEVKKKEKAK